MYEKMLSARSHLFDGMAVASEHDGIASVKRINAVHGARSVAGQNRPVQPLSTWPEQNRNTTCARFAMCAACSLTIIVHETDA